MEGLTVGTINSDKGRVHLVAYEGNLSGECVVKEILRIEKEHAKKERRQHRQCVKSLEDLIAKLSEK